MDDIRQFGGFLGKLLGPLLKTGLSWIRNVLKPFAKSVLIQLGLIASASATDAKKMFGSSNTILINPNEGKNDIMKLAKSLNKKRYLN